jgi:hypothetical protein
MGDTLKAIRQTDKYQKNQWKEAGAKSPRSAPDNPSAMLLSQHGFISIHAAHWLEQCLEAEQYRRS